MALSLYRLMQFYHVEVVRGRYGVGEYHLIDSLTYSGQMPTLAPVATPRDIVLRLRSCATTGNSADHNTGFLQQLCIVMTLYLLYRVQ